MIQEILVYLTFTLAVVYLIQKMIWKKESRKKGCGKDCNCM